jgi:hypothetical protein
MDPSDGAYSTFDFTRFHPRFAEMEELRELNARVHRLGDDIAVALPNEDNYENEADADDVPPLDDDDADDERHSGASTPDELIEMEEQIERAQSLVNAYCVARSRLPDTTIDFAKFTAYCDIFGIEETLSDLTEISMANTAALSAAEAAAAEAEQAVSGATAATASALSQPKFFDNPSVGVSLLLGGHNAVFAAAGSRTRTSAVANVVAALSELTPTTRAFDVKFEEFRGNARVVVVLAPSWAKVAALTAAGVAGARAQYRVQDIDARFAETVRYWDFALESSDRLMVNATAHMISAASDISSVLNGYAAKMDALDVQPPYEWLFWPLTPMAMAIMAARSPLVRVMLYIPSPREYAEHELADDNLARDLKLAARARDALVSRLFIPGMREIEGERPIGVAVLHMEYHAESECSVDMFSEPTKTLWSQVIGTNFDGIG